MTIWTQIRRWLADEHGATAIEYALICAMMAVVVVAVTGMGGALDILWTELMQVVEAMGL